MTEIKLVQEAFTEPTEDIKVKLERALPEGIEVEYSITSMETEPSELIKFNYPQDFYTLQGDDFITDEEFNETIKTVLPSMVENDTHFYSREAGGCRLSIQRIELEEGSYSYDILVTRNYKRLIVTSDFTEYKPK